MFRNNGKSPFFFAVRNGNKLKNEEKEELMENDYLKTLVGHFTILDTSLNWGVPQILSSSNRIDSVVDNSIP